MSEKTGSANVVNGSTSSQTQRSSEKSLKTIDEKYADATLRFVEQYGRTVAPLSPTEEKKLGRKL